MKPINTIFDSYYFKGTDEQIKEAGFTIVKGENFKAIKRFNDASVFIGHTNQVYTFNGENIRDLIDKGLVEKVEKNGSK